MLKEDVVLGESRHEPVFGLHSRVIGQVALDQKQLDAEIETLLGFEFNQGYSSYATGNPGWRNCVLRNETGSASDIVFGGYDGPSAATPLLEQLPYLAELITATFNPEALRWARIFLCEQGMLIPHRDYLDLPEDEFTRVHIPLRLGRSSLHSEGDHVFRMRQGEIWFIDGTVAHAAYSYDGAPRIYLSCDFVAGVPFQELIRDKDAIKDNVVPDLLSLPPLPDDFEASLESMAGLLAADNVDDVVSILSKVHFSHKTNCAASYDWLMQMAKSTGQEELVALAAAKREFFLGF